MLQILIMKLAAISKRFIEKQISSILLQEKIMKSIDKSNYLISENLRTNIQTPDQTHGKYLFSKFIQNQSNRWISVHHDQRKYYKPLTICYSFNFSTSVDIGSLLAKLKQIEQRKGKEHMDCVPILQYLGKLYRHNKLYKEAFSYYQRCLNIVENHKGKQSLQCQSILQKIGQLYGLVGNYKQSLQTCQKSLQIIQKLKGKDGIQSQHLLRNIAFLNNKFNNHEKSYQFYKRTLSVIQKIAGKQHIQCVKLLINMGIELSHLKRYDQALQQYQNSAQILKKLKRQISSQCATIYSSMAHIKMTQKKYQQALNYFTQTQNIQQQMYGKGNLQSIQIIQFKADSLRMIGKYQEAISNLQSCLKSIQIIKGKDSIDYVLVLIKIGQLQHNNQQIDKMIESYVQAYDILYKIDPNALLGGQICFSLGHQYHHSQKYQAAIVYIQKAEVIFVAQGKSIQLMKTIQILIDCYEKIGNLQKHQISKQKFLKLKQLPL